MMSEKIFLTYTNATAAPYQGSVLGHHIVLNYIDANGAHHTLQGVPEHSFQHNIDKLGAFIREEALSDGTNNRDSPFGRLQTATKRDTDVSLNQPHTLVAEGDDLSARWALMQDFADEVNSIGYEYRPLSQNSNSFAGAALQRGGFFGPGNKFPERFDGQLVVDPVSGETKSLYTPGFENPLTNPINDATPMPFPLGAPAAPFAPSNGFPAPDHPDSFDPRFGSSRASPAGGPSNTLSPLLRALQKYSDSALPNATDSNPSQASVFDTGVPPVRRLTSRNKSLSADSQNSFGASFGNPTFSAADSVPLSSSQSATPPAQFLPDQLNPPGGLAGWIAALAGIDPQNPDQSAPSLQDDQLRGFRDEPTRPWPIRSLR
jgi:hypothetical protein